jgi:hypothetical protein
MINSDLTTYAAKRLGITLLVALAFGGLLLAGMWDVETEGNIERDYCQRVAAGTHSHYNTDIDCKFKL